MDSSGKTILKHSLSYLQKHDGVQYADALKIIAKVIETADTLNNPLFEHLLESGLPGDPEQLHELLKPGAIHD